MMNVDEVIIDVDEMMIEDDKVNTYA